MAVMVVVPPAAAPLSIRLALRREEKDQ